MALVAGSPKSAGDKNFSWRKINICAAKVSGETTNNCELPERRTLARLIEIPFLDFKQIVFNEEFPIGFDQRWRNVIEINAL